MEGKGESWLNVRRHVLEGEEREEEFQLLGLRAGVLSECIEHSSPEEIRKGSVETWRWARKEVEVKEGEHRPVLLPLPPTFPPLHRLCLDRIGSSNTFESPLP